MSPQVPVFNLARAERRIAADLDVRWRRLRRDTAFVGGVEVAEFENEYGTFLGAAGCVGVANGTDALVLALRALDLQPGDEVVVPAFSFVATAAAVLLAGGRPVFADVSPETLNLDVASAAAKLTARTVGIIGVHLYGRPFDLDAAQELCREHSLWLVEDAAQAHGASWNGRRVGTFGELATWSFYPAKNLGCFGDGGAVTGSDATLLERVRSLANHGRAAHYHHVEVGTNSRLDALQAAVLLCRLPLLDGDNANRRQVAAAYQAGFGAARELTLLTDPGAAEPVYHQFTLLCDRRDALKEHLAERGIAAAIHYPEPLHRQPGLVRVLGEPDALPVAEAAAQRVLCLPMFPELEDVEVAAVVAAVREFAESSSGSRR